MSREVIAFDDCEALKETDAALLVTIEGEEVWVPKSQIDGSSDIQETDDTGTLVLNEWWAIEKGLV